MDIELDETEDKKTVHISEEMKADTLNRLEKVYENLEDTGMIVEETSTITEALIGTLNQSDATLVSIEQLKISDEYTFKHCVDVAVLSMILAKHSGKSDANIKDITQAGLLHDIGKAVDFEQEGSHVELGAKYAKKYGENPIVINSIEAHHGDTAPQDIIAVIVAAADTLSAARPGARYESLEGYIERLENLEKIATGFEGVERAFAIQAGREIRIMVKPEVIDDVTMVKTAHDIREKIENELTYPGQIKVTLIREVRVNELAK